MSKGDKSSESNSESSGSESNSSSLSRSRSKSTSKNRDNKSDGERENGKKRDDQNLKDDREKHKEDRENRDYNFDRDKEKGDSSSYYNARKSRNELEAMTYLERRRVMREKMPLKSPVWEPSPSPPRERREKGKNRSRSNSPDAPLPSVGRKMEDEEEERRKKRKKEKKMEKKEKREKKRQEKKARGEVESEKSESSETDSDDDKKKKKKKKRKHKSSSSDEDDDSLWLEKPAEDLPKEEVVGPKPLGAVDTNVDYGKQMMPGEAEAYAKFVQDDKRIPRRGEIGLTSNEITHFEDVGFVMSGSRHKRMNAVRLRKESQIYSAEEKRLLAQVNYEEKAKRENKILADFRDLVHQKVSGTSKSKTDNDV